jgi:hypothetical protein
VGANSIADNTTTSKGINMGVKPMTIRLDNFFGEVEERIKKAKRKAESKAVGFMASKIKEAAPVGETGQPQEVGARKESQRRRLSSRDEPTEGFARPPCRVRTRHGCRRGQGRHRSAAPVFQANMGRQCR